jgi:hypothetical protein
VKATAEPKAKLNNAELNARARRPQGTGRAEHHVTRMAKATTSLTAAWRQGACFLSAFGKPASFLSTWAPKIGLELRALANDWRLLAATLQAVENFNESDLNTQSFGENIVDCVTNTFSLINDEKGGLASHCFGLPEGSAFRTTSAAAATAFNSSDTVGRRKEIQDEFSLACREALPDAQWLPFSDLSLTPVAYVWRPQTRAEVARAAQAFWQSSSGRDKSKWLEICKYHENLCERRATEVETLPVTLPQLGSDLEEECFSKAWYGQHIERKYLEGSFEQHEATRQEAAKDPKSSPWKVKGGGNQPDGKAEPGASKSGGSKEEKKKEDKKKDDKAEEEPQRHYDESCFRLERWIDGSCHLTMNQSKEVAERSAAAGGRRTFLQSWRTTSRCSTSLCAVPRSVAWWRSTRKILSTGRSPIRMSTGGIASRVLRLGSTFSRPRRRRNRPRSSCRRRSTNWSSA